MQKKTTDAPTTVMSLESIQEARAWELSTMFSSPPLTKIFPPDLGSVQGKKQAVPMSSNEKIKDALIQLDNKQLYHVIGPLYADFMSHLIPTILHKCVLKGQKKQQNITGQLLPVYSSPFPFATFTDSVSLSKRILQTTII